MLPPGLAQQNSLPLEGLLGSYGQVNFGMPTSQLATSGILNPQTISSLTSQLVNNSLSSATSSGSLTPMDLMGLSGKPLINPYTTNWSPAPSSPYNPNVIPSLTSNHLYNALLGLSPAQQGGEAFLNNMEKAKAASQGHTGVNWLSRLGAGFSDALTGGIGGAMLGAPLFGIGAIPGGVLGALGGLGVGLGTGYNLPMSTGNAGMSVLGNLEKGNIGGILPGIANQLGNVTAPPNYSSILNPLTGWIPSVSPLPNVPILNAVTNPRDIANFLIQTAANPLSYIPGVGEAGAAMSAEEAANSGLSSTVQDLTGSPIGATLTREGGLLRNQIAQGLGFSDYGAYNTATQAPGIESTFLKHAFGQQFGQQVLQNPTQFINNVGLRMNPFPGINIPLLSQKTIQNLHDIQPFGGRLASNLNDNQIVNGIKQFFGTPASMMQMEKH